MNFPLRFFAFLSATTVADAFNTYSLYPRSNIMAKNLPGVYTTTKKDGTTYYRASLTYRNKHISLGSYETAVTANQAYLEALELLTNDSLSIDSYSVKKTLKFEKWVSIINFRDNGLYLSNPIYIRPKFFLYYLSPTEVYTFDTDDLFYYSSHKIMKRGGHLFVSDYGLQTNIQNRYGIKSYAVCGRDYIFINGNPHDYRYSNIEIINRYNGVAKIMKKNMPFYQAKIHINGDYLIGTYETETEAAIAYNKAIDTLKKAGCNKNYTPNFPDIPNNQYAVIYDAVPISKKILELTFPYNQ